MKKNSSIAQISDPTWIKVVWLKSTLIKKIIASRFQEKNSILKLKPQTKRTDKNDIFHDKETLVLSSFSFDRRHSPFIEKTSTTYPG